MCGVPRRRHAEPAGGSEVDRVDGFGERYVEAREIGYQALEDQILDLSDEAALDMTAVAKARLQTDNRKWILAKSQPKRYGGRGRWRATAMRRW